MTSTLQERIRSFPDGPADAQNDRKGGNGAALRQPRLRRVALMKSSRKSEGQAWPQMGNDFEKFLTKLLDLRERADARALARATVALTELHSAVPDGHAGVDDDGEVVLFWLNGHRSVEIIVPPDGPFYARVTDAQGSEVLCASTDVLPIELIRKSLRSIPSSHDLRFADTIREW